MITYLHNLSFEHWLALATLLLIFEVFGAGGYLLWVGLMAVAVGAVVSCFPSCTGPGNSCCLACWRYCRHCYGGDTSAGLSAR